MRAKATLAREIPVLLTGYVTEAVPTGVVKIGREILSAIRTRRRKNSLSSVRHPVVTLCRANAEFRAFIIDVVWHPFKRDN